jgi:hypothetical protein
MTQHYHDLVNAALEAAKGNQDTAPDLRRAVVLAGLAHDCAPEHVKRPILRLKRRLETEACYAQRETA